MAPARSVALAAIVVLAGCSGIATDDPDRATITPAPVPTPTATPESIDRTLAPGLDPDGVHNPNALVEAHARALQNRSFTSTYAEIRHRADGTLALRYTRRVRLAADRDRYCYRTALIVNRDLENRSMERYVERWSNGERVLEAIERDGTTTYGVTQPNYSDRPWQTLPFDPLHKRGLFNLFLQVNTTPTGWIAQNDTTHYRVEDAGTGTSALPAVQNLSLQARIADTGLIHGYRISYAVTVDDAPMTIDGMLRFGEIGNTTIDRPPWADRALANQTRDHAAISPTNRSAWC